MFKVVGMFLICIGAALAAAFGVFLLQDGEQSVQSVETDASEISTEANASAMPPPGVPDISLAKSARTMTDAERHALIEQIQTQLDALMKDYENHIKDREKREELKQEIDILVTKYNELILPVALTDVGKQIAGSK